MALKFLLMFFFIWPNILLNGNPEATELIFCAKQENFLRHSGAFEF